MRKRLRLWKKFPSRKKRLQLKSLLRKRRKPLKRRKQLKQKVLRMTSWLDRRKTVKSGRSANGKFRQPFVRRKATSSSKTSHWIRESCGPYWKIFSSRNVRRFKAWFCRMRWRETTLREEPRRAREDGGVSHHDAVSFSVAAACATRTEPAVRVGIGADARTRHSDRPRRERFMRVLPFQYGRRLWRHGL